MIWKFFEGLCITCSLHPKPNPESTNPTFISWNLLVVLICLKTYFCLRIKIDTNCYWKSQFQSKQNSFSWKKFRIGRFRICCLIWWTSYWINMSWKKIPYVLVFTKQPCHACNIYNPNSHFQLKYIHIWDYWKTRWKYISIPSSLHTLGFLLYVLVLLYRVINMYLNGGCGI